MSETRKIRVGLVDDHAMVHQSLAAVLGDEENIEVVGSGEDTRAAIDLVDRFVPDVLVLDYNLPGGGSLSVIEHVLRKELPVRILILTVHGSAHYAVRVLEAGASGFVVKSSAVEELKEAILALNRGEVYITPKLSRAVMEQLRRPRGDRRGLESLSEREFELLRMLAGGLRLGDAAQKLKVSVSTASTYRARLLRKLGLESTGDLIRYALENGLDTR